MKKALAEVGPQFVDMAHRIGMCIAATVDHEHRPHTRVLQPVWEWDGDAVTGWASTDSTSPKWVDLVGNPTMSITYWQQTQDTCTADCEVDLVTDLEQRARAWERFLAAPPPAGFDPAVHPDWESPESPTFGVLRLRPTWLRVMPGTHMTAGTGEVWTWRGASRAAA